MDPADGIVYRWTAVGRKKDAVPLHVRLDVWILGVRCETNSSDVVRGAEVQLTLPNTVASCTSVVVTNDVQISTCANWSSRLCVRASED